MQPLLFRLKWNHYFPVRQLPSIVIHVVKNLIAANSFPPVQIFDRLDFAHSRLPSLVDFLSLTVEWLLVPPVFGEEEHISPIHKRPLFRFWFFLRKQRSL